MFTPPPLRRTLAAALRDVGDPKPAVRADAARDLVHHAEAARPEVVRALERVLRDPSHDVRAVAAVALADLRASEALPSLLVAVEDDHPYVRQMALAALGEIGDSRATERLRRALGDERPEVRFQAVIAFGRVARDEAADALLAATRDDDPSIRYIALRMAEEHAEEDDGRVPVSLVARAVEMLADDASNVRVVAAIVLARAGDPAGGPVLADVVAGKLATTEAEDEARAVELAGELGLRDAERGLERRAFGLRRLTTETFAWQAKVALARMGHARAKSEILRDLRSWSRDRRTLAVAAAARARLLDALPDLERMRDDHRLAEPTAVAEALATLSRFARAIEPAPSTP